MIRYRDWAKDLKVCFWLLIALACSVVHCSTAEACNHCGFRGRFCRFQNHHVQKFVAVQHHQPAYQVTYNFVGLPIRLEAMLEKAKQQDPEYNAFQQFKLFRQSQEKVGVEPTAVDSILAKKCASCHSGDKPSASLLLDGTGEITPDLMGKIRNSVLSGKMPKDRPPLSKEEFDNLALELGIYLEEWFKKEE